MLTCNSTLVDFWFGDAKEVISILELSMQNVIAINYVIGNSDEFDPRNPSIRIFL